MDAQSRTERTYMDFDGGNSKELVLELMCIERVIPETRGG